MERLTCKFENENVLRATCTFDRESSTQPDDCSTCGMFCSERWDCSRENPCDGCPMQ